MAAAEANVPDSVELDDDRADRLHMLSASDFDRHQAGNKHERFELLIFSEAGKPIYSYTKREDAVTLMPVCCTLINYAKKSQKETLHYIKTSDSLIIRFTTRSPLIIIVAHEANSYVDSLTLVDQIEAQVISILTAKTLTSVFEDRPTFDLKRLLYGSEKLIDSTANLCAFPKRLRWPWVEAFLAVSGATQLGVSSSSNVPMPQTLSPALPLRPHRVLVPIVIIPQGTRETIHNILQNVISNNSKNMVFSLLFRVDSKKTNNSTPNGRDEPGENSQNLSSSSGSIGSTHDEADKVNLNDVINFKLLTVCNHHNSHKLKITDIHIILALLTGSRSQLASVESLWMPICLPKFNRDAFVHSYIAYLSDNKHCLVMMSIDRDEFANCQKAKNMIEEKLEGMLKDSSLRNKIYYRLPPLIHPALIDLQDKIVSQSLTSDEIAEVRQQAQTFNTKQEPYHARQLQFLWYQTSKHVLLWQRSSQRSINPIIYYVTKKMLQSSLKHLWLKLADDTILLGWHVPTFQLYAQFDSTITTNEATEVIQRITNWIKKEEDNFSIKDYR